jgi:hypothetical protein
MYFLLSLALFWCLAITQTIQAMKPDISGKLDELSTAIQNLGTAIGGGVIKPPVKPKQPPVQPQGPSIKEPVLVQKFGKVRDDFFKYVTNRNEDQFRTEIGWLDDKAIAKDIPTKPDAIKKYIEGYEWPGPGSGNFPRAAIFASNQGFMTAENLYNEITKGGTPAPLLPQAKFNIIYQQPGSLYEVDVVYLQSRPENNGAVFQVASTFFGPLEGSIVAPSQELMDMTQHPAQGEWASMSGAGATIWTKYVMPTAIPNKPKWPRSGKRETRELAPYFDNYYYLCQKVGTFTLPGGYNVQGIPVYVDKKTMLPELDFNVLALNNPTDIVGQGPRALIEQMGVVVKRNVVVTCGSKGNNEQTDSYPMMVVWDPATNQIDPTKTQIVSQVFCSAFNLNSTRFLDWRTNNLPALKIDVNQGMTNVEDWARLIIHGGYSATFCAAYYLRQPKVFLTMLGGGAFSNKPEWIADALEQNRKLIKDLGLEVNLVYRAETKPRKYFQRSAQTDFDFLVRMLQLKADIENQQFVWGPTEQAKLKTYVNSLYPAASQMQ